MTRVTIVRRVCYSGGPGSGHLLPVCAVCSLAWLPDNMAASDDQSTQVSPNCPSRPGQHTRDFLALLTTQRHSLQ